MATPVVLSTNGFGAPVTVVESIGLPVEIAENGFGIPVIEVSTGGVPVTYQGGGPPVDLLAGLEWTAGASTTFSTADGRARGTAQDAGVNPRIYKGPVSLALGTTYRLQGNLHKGTTTGDIFLRVATDTSISDGTQLQTGDPGTTAVNQTFVAASTGDFYFGVVAVISDVGQYFEIDDDFSLTEVG